MLSRGVGLNSVSSQQLSAHQDTIKDVVYRTVTGPEFTMQIRAIADALVPEATPSPLRGTPPLQGGEY